MDIFIYIFIYSQYKKINCLNNDTYICKKKSVTIPKLVKLKYLSKISDKTINYSKLNMVYLFHRVVYYNFFCPKLI